MSRFALAICLLLITAIAYAITYDKQSQEPVIDYRLEQEKLLLEEINQEEKFEQEYLKKLELPCELKEIDLSLQDFVSHLKEKFQLPIVIDTKALEEEGVSMDEPVGDYIYGKYRNYRQVIKLLEDKFQIEFFPQHGVIKVTTITVADKNENFIHKFYDISWCKLLPQKRIVDELGNHYPQGGGGGFFQLENKPTNQVEKNHQPPSTNVESSTQKPEAVKPAEKFEIEYYTAADLMTIITRGSNNGSWSEYHGDGGTLSEILKKDSHYLSVNNSPKAQQEVAQFLAKLRYLEDPAFMSDPQIKSIYAEDLRIEQQLNTKMDTPPEECTIKQFIKTLEDQLKIPVFLDLNAIEEEGISEDQLIKKDYLITSLTYRQLLQGVLQSLNMSYFVRGGILWISPKTACDKLDYYTCKVHKLDWLELTDYQIKPTRGQKCESEAYETFLETLREITFQWENIDGEGGSMHHLKTKNGHYALIYCPYQAHLEIDRAIMKLKIKAN